MANIHVCRNGRNREGRFCAYAKVILVGKRGYFDGCALGRHDHYNLYPNHDASTGDYVYNDPYWLSDPKPPGVAVTYENDSSHETGLTVDPDFRKGPTHSKGQDGLPIMRLGLRCEFDHPCYHVKQINIPAVSRMMGDDEVGEVFGFENMAIMVNRWNEQRIYGIPRVERCDQKIYGAFDSRKSVDRIIPKCLQDFSQDSPHWHNFSTKPRGTGRKELYLEGASKEDIANFCLRYFHDQQVAANIYRIILAIQAGAFVNIWEAMLNNGVARDRAGFIMSKIALRSTGIYPSRYNIEMYVRYYMSLDRLFAGNPNLIQYKCNLLNYILNHPKLKDIDFELNNMWVCFRNKSRRARYDVGERYWFLYMLLMRAKREGILKPDWPEWLDNLMLQVMNKKKVYESFDNVEKDFRELEDEEKSDTAEAMLLNLEDPIDLYPAMHRIEDIINLEEETDEGKLKLFFTILRMGRYWSFAEVRFVWERFSRAYFQNKPQVFWRTIENLATKSKLTREDGKDKVVPLEREDIDNMMSPKYGPGFSQGLRFAERLIMYRIDIDSFELSEIPDSRWDLIVPKQSSKGKRWDQRYGACWIALSKIGGLWADGKEDIIHLAGMELDQFIDSGDEDEDERNMDDFDYQSAIDDDVVGDMDFMTVKEVDIGDREDDEYDSLDPMSFLDDGEFVEEEGGEE